MSFDEIADRRILSTVRANLDQLTWDVEADGYQRLRVPSSADVDSLLRLLSRRGLEPALMHLLLDRFEDRPLERALIAFDIAAGSLLGHDDLALAQRVAAVIAPLAPIGPNTVAVPRDRVGALIDAASATGEVGTSANDPAAIEASLAYADQLAPARLPSLALAIVQVLWTRHALPAALDRIVEIALDHERLDSMPQLTEKTDRSIQLQTYFATRVSLSQLDTTAAAILEQTSKHPAIASSSDPGLAAVRAELDLLTDKPVSVAAIEAVAPIGSAWRYGSRVRDQIRIQSAPGDAAIVVDGFLGTFGNDMRVWAQAAFHPSPELLALVSREIRYCSHEPEVWRALATFLEDGTLVEVELQARTAAQLDAALG